jgi:hypothetical protein
MIALAKASNNLTNRTVKPADFEPAVGEYSSRAVRGE